MSGMGVLRSWVLWTLIALFLVIDQQWWHKLLFDFTPIGLRAAWLAAGALVIVLIMMFSRSPRLVRAALMLYATATLAFLMIAQPDFAVAVVLLLAGNALLLFIVRRREWFDMARSGERLDAKTSMRLQKKSWYAVDLALAVVSPHPAVHLGSRASGHPRRSRDVAWRWHVGSSSAFVLVLFPRSRGWPALTRCR
jgi:hypothetical protein